MYSAQKPVGIMRLAEGQRMAILEVLERLKKKKEKRSG